MLEVVRKSFGYIEEVLDFEGVDLRTYLQQIIGLEQFVAAPVVYSGSTWRSL